MKTINDYLNDPSLVDEPEALREVHAARLKIQDETKSMTAEEKKAYYHDGAAAFFAQLGITPKYADFSGQDKLKSPQPVSL
jgi:Zn/Cd-binding protein ZinT